MANTNHISTRATLVNTMISRAEMTGSASWPLLADIDSAR